MIAWMNSGHAWTDFVITILKKRNINHILKLELELHSHVMMKTRSDIISRYWSNILWTSFSYLTLIYININHTTYSDRDSKMIYILKVVTSQYLGAYIAWCNFLICILLKYVGIFSHACRSPWPRSSVRATFASKFPATTKIKIYQPSWQ